jgi:hypothetical protein
MPEFTWSPANRAAAEEIEAVFATGGARKCRCQAVKVPGWIWRDTTQEQRDAALLEQTACGTAGPTSGLIGYVDGEPAGWVAVEQRANYPRLWSRKQAWMRMDPELAGVWSVTCFVVRKGWRQTGLTYELAAATVEYGQQVGASVLEGYPIEPPPGRSVIWDEASVGLVQIFLEAGYRGRWPPPLCDDAWCGDDRMTPPDRRRPLPRAVRASHAPKCRDCAVAWLQRLSDAAAGCLSRVPSPDLVE